MAPQLVRVPFSGLVLYSDSYFRGSASFDFGNKLEPIKSKLCFVATHSDVFDEFVIIL